jgi:hypothetical protein
MSFVARDATLFEQHLRLTAAWRRRRVRCNTPQVCMTLLRRFLAAIAPIVQHQAACKIKNHQLNFLNAF